jgi:hypothetical protein
MTLNESIGAIIAGQHVMGDEPGTRDYWAVQYVKKGMRKHQPSMRYMAIKRALKNYRVTVTQTPDWKVRVFCPATKLEIVL